MKISHLLLSLLIVPAILPAAEIGKIPAGPLSPRMTSTLVIEIKQFDWNPDVPRGAMDVLAALRRYGTFDEATKASYQPVILELQRSAARLMERAQNLPNNSLSEENFDIATKMHLLTDGYVPVTLLGKMYGPMINELQNNPALSGMHRLKEVEAKIRAMTAALLGMSADRLPEDMTPAWAMPFPAAKPKAARLEPAGKDAVLGANIPAPVMVPAVKNAAGYELMDLAAMEKLSMGYKAWLGSDGSSSDMEFFLQNKDKKFQAQGYLFAERDGHVVRTYFKTSLKDDAQMVFLGRKFFFRERSAGDFARLVSTRVPVLINFTLTSNPFRLSGSPFKIEGVTEAPTPTRHRGIEGMVFGLGLGAALLWPSMAHAASLGMMAHAVWTAVEWLTAAIFVLSLIRAIIQKKWKGFILFWLMQKLIPWLIRRFKPRRA